MQINYFKNKCIACNACIVIAPHIWNIDSSNGKAELFESSFEKLVYKKTVWDDDVELAKTFEKACPTKAIKLSK